MEVMQGSVENWNHTSGFGIIRSTDGKTYYAHHKNFQSKGRKIVMEIGQDVSFTPDGTQAIGINYDTRSALYRFAYFHNFEKAIDILAREFAAPEKWSSSDFDEEAYRLSVITKAETENWLQREQETLIKRRGNADGTRARQGVSDKIDKYVLRKKYEVLISFFERTFERAKLEDKIVTGSNIAGFNTALGDKFNGDIYAIFKPDRKGNGWVFDKFADENFVIRALPEIPEPPNYFIDVTNGERVPSDHMFLDVEKKIAPDTAHLFDERRSRFPDSWKNRGDQDCANDFNRLLDRTKQRVRRNFRAAVPFYYPALRKIQMLLPVTFNLGESTEETRALVVTRVGAGYSVETIMPLAWAYKNARLLAKPDREDWLDF
jgi:cold shock CspA family protein